MSVAFRAIPLPPAPSSQHHQNDANDDRQKTKMASKLLASAIRRQTLTTKPASTASDFVRTLSTAAAVAETYDDPDGVSMKGVKISGRPLYLDMQATSPVDPRVVDAMLPYYLTRYGNPHSRTHMYGWESDSAVETARAQVADLIGASPKEIVFTSGATECNNISVKGVMHFYKDKKRHVITTQTEHKCVLDSCRHLQQEGYDVTYLPVKTDGLIDLDELRSSIRPDTGLVSVMAVNNEIGVIQPMEEIGEICKQFKIPFHTDAAQALGKIPIDVDKWNVSLMSLSGHKVYGPKGVGALYMRRRPRIRVEPQMNGGGQERGIRSGTVPTPLVVGFGAACEIAKKEMEYDEKRVRALQDRMLKGIRKNLDMVVVNGSEERRYPGNLNLSFAYVEGESLLMGLKEVAVSSGSACTSASLEPSYVLRALGVDEDMAHTSIRFGIGRFTTEEEIDRAVQLTVQQVKKLRELSPLYEMVKEGIDIKSIQWSQH
ncbi:cysteine desulfurase, mitochondrial-like [Pyrus communis]|uniref:cysteine desulfurase, mitochondrial-like n=1 Tax=Pyrus communis TaxID=23211 RepID=UPI0035BF3E4C